MDNSTLTAARARELLHYDSETGVLTWKVSRKGGGAVAGKVAGYLDKRGYWNVGLDGRRYRAHRIAWLIHTGEWPALDLDHKSGARSANWIGNLRDVPRRVNAENRRHARTGTTTGLLGVTTAHGKFQAQIRVNKKNKYLGLFDTPEEAHAVYVTAKRQLHAGCTI